MPQIYERMHYCHINMIFYIYYFLDKTQCMATRTVLWYLVFTGFAINYMIRINLNIAIVSMVKPRPKSNESLTSECIAAHLNQSVVNINTIVGTYI